jgi:thymidine kinase
MINVLPAMTSAGRLTIITGPMFSGKTTELLRLYERKRRAKINCLLVKYSGDRRYATDAVWSHSYTDDPDDPEGLHQLRIGGVPAISLDKLSALFEVEMGITEYDTVFIDEIQFFPDKEQVLHLLTLDIDVNVSGLNGDYLRRPFPGMDQLFALAYQICSLRAVCGFCRSEEACFTTRLSTTDSAQILVGGAELYRASCLRCHLAHAPPS